MYEITYRDQQGRQRVHKYSGNESNARGWAKNLSSQSKAVCEHVDFWGKRKHIVSEGHD